MKRQDPIATELETFEDCLAMLPVQRQWAKAVFKRLGHITTLPDGALVLDVGAAAGGFLIACNELGYQAVGIEPCEEARRNAARMSERLGIPIQVVPGTAESVPYPADTFDVVHASSVMEHVLDLDAAIHEIYRVLKPGGVFWFNSASAMCPSQGEIRGFPFFGWYPHALKLRLMHWAKENRPELVGYTETPAIHWFTRKGAYRLLHGHGFRQVYDRWELRGQDEGGRMHGRAIRLIRLTAASRFLADVMVSGCSYAAIK